MTLNTTTTLSRVRYLSEKKTGMATKSTHRDGLEIRDGLIFDIYPGLPHILKLASSMVISVRQSLSFKVAR